MKPNHKTSAYAISLAMAGLLAASAAQAATKPASIFKFNANHTHATLVAKSKGWRDPAFGDMGWTHSSAWGNVIAKKGQLVTINIKAVDAGIHPGATVWYRGVDDTAPDNYVVDHFYPQNANFVKYGATDETTGAAIGDIVMRHVTRGFDKDGNSSAVTSMKPLTDGIPGQMTLSFTAPKTGVFIFVVGGFNPDATVNTTLKYNFTTDVTVTTPVVP